jgi:hypothetical protein
MSHMYENLIGLFDLIESFQDGNKKGAEAPLLRLVDRNENYDPDAEIIGVV